VKSIIQVVKPVARVVQVARFTSAPVPVDDPRLSDARPPLAHQHAAGDVTDLQEALGLSASDPLAYYILAKN
jgi:hypothetical protein